VPTKADHVRALSRVCRRFSGQLAVISQHAFDSLFDQPFDHMYGNKELSESPTTTAHGLWWRKKIIYAVRGRENVNGIIHEMGHVFAAPHHPDCACSACHEWDWLGWEIVLARQIGAMPMWSYHNADYGVGEGGLYSWGRLTPKRRRIVVADRIAHARKAGFLGVDNELRSKR
jgi:hypothetical protein